jgi:hypothetical protein
MSPERDDDGKPETAGAGAGDAKRPRTDTKRGIGSPPPAPGRPGGQDRSGSARMPQGLVAASRDARPGSVVRRVVLASEAGVTPREQRLWCAGRASVHLDVALSALGDVLPCVEYLDADIAAGVHEAAAAVWALRERLFLIVEEYDEPDEREAPPEGG